MMPIAESVLMEITVRQLQAQTIELLRIIAEINNAMNEMSRVLKIELAEHVNNRLDERLREVDELRDECVLKLRELKNAIR